MYHPFVRNTPHRSLFPTTVAFLPRLLLHRRPQLTKFPSRLDLTVIREPAAVVLVRDPTARLVLPLPVKDLSVAHLLDSIRDEKVRRASLQHVLKRHLPSTIYLIPNKHIYTTHALVEEVVDDIVEVREDVGELRQRIERTELVHHRDHRRRSLAAPFRHLAVAVDRRRRSLRSLCVVVIAGVQGRTGGRRRGGGGARRDERRGGTHRHGGCE